MKLLLKGICPTDFCGHDVQLYPDEGTGPNAEPPNQQGSFLGVCANCGAEFDTNVVVKYRPVGLMEAVNEPAN